MTPVRLALVAIAAALLAGCGGDPDPWSATASYATTAQPGVPTLLRSHGNFRPTEEACDIEPAPQIEIIQDGRLGAITVSPQSEPIVLPETPCDGESAETTAVFYEAPADAAGFDTVIYRELSPGAAPDVTYTATVRLR
jgi:hypothetical protein